LKRGGKRGKRREKKRRKRKKRRGDAGKLAFQIIIQSTVKGGERNPVGEGKRGRGKKERPRNFTNHLF